MNPAQASRTAEAVAAVRAHHHRYEAPLIFDDPWAIALTSPSWRRVCRSRVLSWLVFDKLLVALRPVQGNVLARARYAEDLLDQALASRAWQYLILGAGLDSFALRQRYDADRLVIWEVDHANSQSQKRQRLKALAIGLPDNVRLIAADLQSTSLTDALSPHGFPFAAPTFISLLGVSYYLTEDALFGLLGTIATQFAAGSRLVMDIRVPRECVDPGYLPVYDKTEQFTRKRGEPMISQFTPAHFIERCQQVGWAVLEHLPPSAQHERYFAMRDDGLTPSPEVHLFCLGIPGA